MNEPKIISEVSTEPVSLVDCYRQLRLDILDSPVVYYEDALIAGLLVTAREHAEKFTGLCLKERVLEQRLSTFPCPTISHRWYPSGDQLGIPLKGPVVELISLTYTDGSGVDQQITDYQTQEVSERETVLIPAQGSTSWPALTASSNAVRIRYLAGYGSANDSPPMPELPKSIKQAMLLMIEHWFENRGDVSMVKLEHIPLGAERLMRNYKVDRGMA